MGRLRGYVESLTFFCLAARVESSVYFIRVSIPTMFRVAYCWIDLTSSVVIHSMSR